MGTPRCDAGTLSQQVNYANGRAATEGRPYNVIQGAVDFIPAGGELSVITRVMSTFIWGTGAVFVQNSELKILISGGFYT